MKKLLLLLALAFCLNGKAQCALTLTVTSTNPKCTGAANGAATVTPSGGAGTITYTWQPTGGNAATASNLSAGTYTCIVMDAVGCKDSTTVTILNPPIFTATVNTTPTICSGSVGSATVTPTSGGMPPYSYTWLTSPIQTGSIAVNLAQGSYSVIVEDANGCSVSAFGIVGVQSPTWSLSLNSTNVTCFGSADGTASATVINPSGGNIFTYSWAPTGQTNSVATNLSAANYTVLVTDNNGCVSASSVTVTQPPLLQASYSLIQDAAPHTWDAYPTYTGGTPPYSYSWDWGDGSVASTSAFPSHTYSVAGTYSICVTLSDTNGCVATYCQNDAVTRLASNNNTLSNMVYINILNSAAGISQISGFTSNILIYPNPTNNEFIIDVNTTDKLNVCLCDVNGKVAPIPNPSQREGKITVDVSCLAEGVYTLTIKTANSVINKKLVVLR